MMRPRRHAPGGVELRRRGANTLRHSIAAFRRKGIAPGGCGGGTGSHAVRGRRNAGVGSVDVAETLLGSMYTVAHCGRLRG